MVAYQCEECGVNFQKLSQLLQHRRTEGHWRKYTCPTCNKSFTRKDNLDWHLKKHQNENNYHCAKCSKVFKREDALENHYIQHKNQIGGAAKRPREDDEVELNKRRRTEPLVKAEDFYNIERVSERKIEKFKTTASYYKITVSDLEIRGIPEILKALKVIFQSIINTIDGDVPSNDLVRISMDNLNWITLL